MREYLNKKLYKLSEQRKSSFDSSKKYLTESDIVIRESLQHNSKQKRINYNNVSELRQNISRIAILHDKILDIFVDLEDGKYARDSEIIHRNLKQKIEEYLELFNEFYDNVDFYRNIPVKQRDRKTGRVIERPIPQKAFNDLVDIWREDADTFEIRRYMILCERKISTKYPSITRAYNNANYPHVLEEEDIKNIFNRIVFGSYEIFVSYKNFITNLIQSSPVDTTIKRNINNIVSDYRPLSTEQIKWKKKLISAMNINKISEGFYNPFDDEDDYLDDTEKQYKRFHVEQRDPNNIGISKIKMWNTNTPNKVICRSNGCFAGKSYTAGDVIEESPVKIISDDATYSKSIRDTAFLFELEDGSIVHGIPLGYVSCYRTKHNSGLEGNVDYELDPETLNVTITAKKNIKRGQELILNTTDNDFANEYTDNKFNYKPGVDPIYTSDIKWV